MPLNNKSSKADIPNNFFNGMISFKMLDSKCVYFAWGWSPIAKGSATNEASNYELRNHDKNGGGGIRKK